MSSFPVYSQDGTEVGNFELELSDLSPEVNRQLLHDAVVMYERNLRQGTVGTKSRGMVSGTNQKMYRQKGTGNARAGGKRTNIRRGGGHAHARVNVDYSFRMPKKAVQLATRMALRSKFEDGQVAVLDELSLSEFSTKQIAQMLKALGFSGVSCLLAIGEYDAVVWRSSRNIPRLSVAPVAEVNSYQLLRQRQLIITRQAIDSFLQPTEAAVAAE